MKKLYNSKLIRHLSHTPTTPTTMHAKHKHLQEVENFSLIKLVFPINQLLCRKFPQLRERCNGS